MGESDGRPPPSAPQLDASTFSPFASSEFQGALSTLASDAQDIAHQSSLGSLTELNSDFSNADNSSTSATRLPGDDNTGQTVDRGNKSILCLHGWRGNNDVSRMHARALGFKRHFQAGVTYLQGPHAANGPADDATAEFFDGPYYTWFEPSDAERRSDQLLISLESVITFVRANGPFHAVFGFSQGAGIATLLSHPTVLDALTGDTTPLWNCCVLACSSVNLDIYQNALGFPIEPASINLPSFHVVGIEDVGRAKSEAAVALFQYRRESRIVRSTIYVSSGHGVPSSLSRDVDFRREFAAWIAAVGSGRTIARRSPGILENVLGAHIGSLGTESLPWFTRKKPNIVVPTSVTGVPGNKLSSELSISEPKESFGPTISFQAQALKDELSLMNHESLLPEDDIEISEGRVSTLFEALERLDGEEPLRMSNGMNFRFQKSNLAILFADPGIRNTWYVGGSVAALLERNPPTAPLICDVDQGRVTTYGDLLGFVSSQGDVRQSLKLGGNSSPTSVVVVYPAPPGPLGAVVLLTILVQCIAMPLDPEARYDDYKAAISQVMENKGAKNTLIAMAFRGITSEQFVSAAKDSGVHVAWQRPRDDLLPGMYEPENPQIAPGRLTEPLRSETGDVSLLLRTSGSTAMPKVVPIKQDALAANAVALSKSLKLVAEDVALNAMPLFHIGGIAASVMATVASGASVLCMERFETGKFYDAITSGRPTWFTAVPTMHLSLMMYGKQLLMEAAEQGGRDVPRPPAHRLRFIRTGAAPLSESDAVSLSSFWGVDIVSTYSMTEQMPISSTMSQSKPGTVGNPLHVSLALVNPETLKPVPWGDTGEICISAGTVITEYYNNTGDARPFFWIGDRRFFRTGDMGLLDDDRFLFIVGRLKELIKMGGEQISPIEIESVVRRHPNVTVAVAFGVPSPTWGEEVGIAVILSPRASDPATKVQEDVRQFARDQLGVSKAPRHWKFLEDASVLPMTASRKYIRNGLAAVLGIEAEYFDAQTVAPKGAPRISSGLSGLRYLLSVGVMFNHIGAVWQGEDERNPLTWGQNFFPGKASTFYFPATVFFVLGGYSLSAALAAREIRGYWSFVSSRFKTLLPLYWFALLLALINLLVVCRPSTYSSSFSWQPNMLTRLLDDGSFAQCQSGPVELPYGWWLFLTLLVFILGMQAWFFAFILVGWILYYSWFFSVYFFVLLVFKWMHNTLVKCRGRGPQLFLWGAVYTLGVMLSAFALGAYYLFPSWQETFNVQEAKSLSYNFANVYALSTVLFPPYWIPVVGSGAVAYFIYDWARPAQSALL